MKDYNPVLDTELLERLKEKYFFDKTKCVVLKKGEELIGSTLKNDKLFMVTSGLVAGFLINEVDKTHEIFRAGKDMFAGVQSFFSPENRVNAQVVALKDSTILYITREDLLKSSEDCYANDFVPLIVHELSIRQQFARNLMIEKSATLKKLYNNEKLATLGQMAAGLAHELNNISAAINGNINWLSQNVTEYVKIKESEEFIKYYEKGLQEGQRQKSTEIRELREKITKKYDLPSSLAKKIVRLGISEKELKNIQKDDFQNKILSYHLFWQMGVAIHDVLLASNHSTHILRSIKQLSTSEQQRCDVDVNDSIHEALTLLRKNIQGIELTTNLSELEIIQASQGELVQVWVNLVKNACESLKTSSQEQKAIQIQTKQINKTVQILISDNGDGISPEKVSKIFQPNFTTKKDGLSFGLGLGLSIVQRIINGYEGTIEVESNSEKTTFIVTLPVI